MATKFSDAIEQERASAAQADRVYGEKPGSEPEYSMLDLLVVALERKKTVGIITAVVFAVSVVLCFVIPKKYTGSVVLMPPQQNTSIAAALSAQLGNLGGAALAGGGGGLGMKNPNDMYVALLKSRTIEDAMVDRFHLQQEYKKKYKSQARKALEDHTTIDGSGKDNLIHLSVEDWNPERAAELANGYLDEFKKLSETLAFTEAGQRRQFFEGQLKQAKDDLANAEEALKVTQQKTGLIQLDAQSRALIETAAQLRGQIAAKQVQIASLQTYATDQNADLVQAERQLENLRAQLAKLGGSESDTGPLIVPQGRVPEAGLEYVRKYRDVKYYETVFEIIARQFEIAKIDEAKQGAAIQVVDKAVPPDRASGVRRLFIVLGGLIGGLLLGIAWVIVESGVARLHTDPSTETKMRRLRRALAWRSGSVKQSA